jgi:hypothetical protein
MTVLQISGTAVQNSVARATTRPRYVHYCGRHYHHHLCCSFAYLCCSFVYLCCSFVYLCCSFVCVARLSVLLVCLSVLFVCLSLLFVCLFVLFVCLFVLFVCLCCSFVYLCCSYVYLCCSFIMCCSMNCLCVNVYCHRVKTQLQLINVSNIPSSSSSKTPQENLSEWLKYTVSLKCWISIRSSHCCVEEHYHLMIINFKKNAKLMLSLFTP